MKAEIKPRIELENRTPLQDVIPLSTPYLVFLDPSSFCNFQCRFCPTGNRKLVSRYRAFHVMKFDMAADIIDSLADMPEPIKTLRLYKDGEPLMNHDLPGIIHHAKATGRFGSIDTTTNGYALYPDVSEDLIRNGLKKLFVSVQGMNEETYRKFSGVNINWKAYVDNIKKFFQLSRGNCELYVKIVGNNLKPGEEQKFYDTFGTFADRVYVERIAPCWPDFDILGVDPNVGIYGQPAHEVLVCPYIFYSISINADGFVSACFLDWKQCMIVGDAANSSMTEIWNNEGLQKMRMNMLMGGRKGMPFCGNCGQMSHGMPDDIDRYRGKILKRVIQ